MPETQLTADTWQTGQDLVNYIQAKYELLLEYEDYKYVLSRQEIETVVGGPAGMAEFEEALRLQIKELKWLEKEKDLVVELYLTNRGKPGFDAPRGDPQAWMVVFLPSDGLERIDFAWKGSDYKLNSVIEKVQKLIDNDGFEEGGRWGVPEVPKSIQ